jgi:hypothetical protein
MAPRQITALDQGIATGGTDERGLRPSAAGAGAAGIAGEWRMPRCGVAGKGAGEPAHRRGNRATPGRSA